MLSVHLIHCLRSIRAKRNRSDSPTAFQEATWSANGRKQTQPSRNEPSLPKSRPQLSNRSQPCRTLSLLLSATAVPIQTRHNPPIILIPTYTIPLPHNP